MLAIDSPLPQFFDSDGTPLENGQLFFGVAGANPETSPITVYWDAAGTQPAAQPVRTSGGMPARNGTPALLYTSVAYSLTVKKSTGVLVYYAANSQQYSIATVVDGLSSATDATKGAGQIGFSYALGYSAGSVGRWLKDLATSAGASLIGFIQAGVGGVLRTVQDKLRETVNPEDFGADPTGATSAVAAINAAATYLSGLGGGVIRGTGKYLIDANLTLPDGVSLVGPWRQPDELLPGSTANYDGLRGLLIISSSATISTSDSAAVYGWIAIRQGLDLPFANAGAATTGVAAFAGTAFTVAGAGSYFAHMLILGFNKAIYSSGFERLRCAYISGDCTNGIEVATCYDISYLHHCHFWPWTTVHQSWTTNALLRRSGTAYLLRDVGDWNKVSDCFSYGYFRGGRTLNCDNVTWIGCGADNTSTAGVGDYTGSIGFSAEGTSKSTRWLGTQAAAQTIGYWSTVSAGNVTKLQGDAWSCSGAGAQVDSGDLHVIASELRDSPIGVNINTTTGRVFIDKNRFRNHSGAPISFAVANSTTYVGRDNDYSGLADGSTVIGTPANWPAQSIASAAAINLPVNGDTFNITGTTNIGTINGGWKDRKVTLYFGGALSVLNSTGATTAVRLSGGTNFAVSAGGTLTIGHNGTQWYEIGRSA